MNKIPYFVADYYDREVVGGHYRQIRPGAVRRRTQVPVFEDPPASRRLRCAAPYAGGRFS